MLSIAVRPSEVVPDSAGSMSYALETDRSGSPIIGKLGACPWVSLMSLAQLLCLSTGSTLSPITLVLRLSNSGLSLAMYPSSVVHTGVKSLGCEKITAHELPIQSWNLMRPSVVSASKLGATSPMRRLMCASCVYLYPTEGTPNGATDESTRRIHIESFDAAPRPDCAGNGRGVWPRRRHGGHDRGGRRAGGGPRPRRRPRRGPGRGARRSSAFRRGRRDQRAGSGGGDRLDSAGFRRDPRPRER